jgi:tetratricopeptide (TPR) repeat protein
MMGYILIAQGKTDQSIAHFERAIQLDALPNAAHFGMMKSLAQLYAAREEWQKSINMMMEYLKFQPEPTPDDMILIAQAYAQMERYNDALPWVQKAIAKAGPKAKEGWYQLELAIHFEKKNYSAAVDLLKTVVARWPGKLKYWEMLSGAHQELEQDADAAAALMAAYHNGLLTEGPKQLNLARMNMYVDLPYQAGRIIEKGMADKTIEAGQKNLELLLQAWTQAREYDKAGAVIDRLAPMTGDGDLYMQKAQVMMEQNEWQKVVEATDQAVELGNLKSPGGAWLMKGIALMELGQLQDARSALKEAQKFDDKTRRQAREWEQFVKDRIEVVASR